MMNRLRSWLIGDAISTIEENVKRSTEEKLDTLIGILSHLIEKTPKPKPKKKSSKKK